MTQWSKCGKYLTGYGLLSRTTDEDTLSDVLDYIDNGHPSIDEDHYCYQALEELRQMTEEEIYQLWRSLHQ